MLTTAVNYKVQCLRKEEVLPYFEKVENFIKDMEALITHK